MIPESLSSGAFSFVERHSLGILAALLLLLIVQTVRLFWTRTAAARRASVSRRLGAQGEREARVILKRKGFRIRDEQKAGSYVLEVDGEAQVVHVRADFVVEQNGRLYIAEVKAGTESAKITGRFTRRQLLEYSFAFNVDSVLLVDIVERRVRQVRFPVKGRAR